MITSEDLTMYGCVCVYSSVWRSHMLLHGDMVRWQHSKIYTTVRPSIPGVGRAPPQQRWDCGKLYKAHAFLFLLSLILVCFLISLSALVPPQEEDGECDLGIDKEEGTEFRKNSFVET